MSFLVFLSPQLVEKTNLATVKVPWHFSGVSFLKHQTRQRKSISSSAFAASGRQAPPCHVGFPVLPQSGNISAVFGLVVSLHKQLGEPESDNRKKLSVQSSKFVLYCSDGHGLVW